MSQKYGKFNNKGVPEAFFDDEVHSNMPEGVVAVTDEDWQLYIGGKFLWTKSGSVPMPGPSASDIAEAEAKALLISTDAKIVRGTEDLIVVLLSKNLLKKTDLPVELVSIIEAREEARGKLKK